MSVRADAETLRQIPIFRECDAVPLQVMAFAAERQNFAPGQAIVTAGAKGTSAYFIMSGHATVSNARERLGTAEPGALLGELAMIGGAPYSVTAIADDQVTTARIDTALFQRVAEEFPEFGRAVLQAVSRKLDGSVKEFEKVRQLMVKARGFSDL
jgi:CRP/FNR family transcriptional regulator, cyclic AMP receptor protein